MRTLSKSKIIAFRQCPKRLWLEIHRPELRDDTGSETAFQIGYHVGEVARRVYVPDGGGTTIDIAALGHKDALAASEKLLTLCQAPIFEAGFTAVGALAYADIMLPDPTTGEPGWKMIEVRGNFIPVTMFSVPDRTTGEPGWKMIEVRGNFIPVTMFSVVRWIEGKGKIKG